MAPNCGPKIFPNKRNQGYLETWMIPGLRVEMYRMIWEYFIKPDTETAIKNCKGQGKRT